jgi:beta-glucanase (GH16 family)
MRAARHLVPLAVAALIGVGAGEPQPPAASAGRTDGSEWRLTWSDEFAGPDRSGPDPARWVYERGGSGWGNNELQTYTDRRENVFVQGGMLVIRARREPFTGPDGIACEYTSGRLKTLGTFSQTYGKFEARIRVPRGPGIWPAFWMLGENIDSAGWPAGGEIDIMENIGKEPAAVHGTIHGPGYSGASAIGAPYANPAGRPFAEDFHVFTLEWEAQALRWYVDGRLYQTLTPASLPAGARWVYDHRFFLLLNVAVGGNWPGDPDETTTFPQEMSVDWVRVYSRAN